MEAGSAAAREYQDRPTINDRVPIGEADYPQTNGG